MLALIDTEINETELLQFFIERSVKVRMQDVNESPKFPMSVLAVDDGFVYHFDGIYAFANTSNMIRQLLVSDPSRFGLVMIDTKEVSKNHKGLVKKIESFASILIPLLAKMTSNKRLKIELRRGYTLSDVREHLIKDSSLL